MKIEIIIPNLKEIRAIIQSNWIGIGVDNKPYIKKLMMHCLANKVGKKISYDEYLKLYENFK
jgi:hypothetical protein